MRVRWVQIALVGLVVGLTSGCGGLSSDDVTAGAESGLTSDGARIASFAERLRRQFDPFEIGFAVDVLTVHGATDKERLSSFIGQRHATDGYVFETGDTDFVTGTKRGALFRSHLTAKDAVLAALQEEYGHLPEPPHSDFPDLDPPSFATIRAEVGALMNQLSHTRAVLGFDGGAISGCGKPTKYLVILDGANRRGYGIDLFACRNGPSPPTR